jgi:MFS-type transporter involved in bile tolerance (Atg22 family)
MRRHFGPVCLLIALAGGTFAGWVDFNNDEPQATVLVILTVTFMVGLLYPQRAWLWAIVIGLCIPGTYLFARSLGYQPVSPPNPGWYTSLLALIPAFIGAFSGALVWVTVNSLQVEKYA